MAALTPEEIQLIIDSKLALPLEVETTTARVKQHSISDLLALQAKIAANAAARRGSFFGMTPRKAVHMRGGE